MNKDEIFQQVVAILEEVFEKDPQSITMETDLIEDLEFDSLDAFDFITEIGDRFKFEVDLEKSKEIQKVETVVQMIERTLNENQ